MLDQSDKTDNNCYKWPLGRTISDIYHLYQTNFLALGLIVEQSADGNVGIACCPWCPRTETFLGFN